MTDEAGTPKHYPASRLLAYTAMGTGVGLALLGLGFGVGGIVWETFVGGEGPSSPRNIPLTILSIILVSIVSIGPGVGFWYYGRRLAESPSFKRVRDMLGAFALIVAILIYGGVETAVMRFGVAGGPIRPPTAFGVIAVMLPVYAIVCRQVLVHDDIVPRSYRAIVPRRLLFICALLMYFSLSGVVDPSAWRVGGLLPMPWPLVTNLLGPILIAYCFYQVTIRVLGHVPKKVRSEAEPESSRLHRPDKD